MILTQRYINELCNFWVMLEAFYSRQKCQSTSEKFFLQRRMHVLRTDGPLAITRLVSKCPTKTFQASCFKGLPKLWNKIPLSVCSLSCFNQFKTLLFKHYSCTFASTYDAIFLELNVLKKPLLFNVHQSANWWRWHTFSTPINTYISPFSKIRMIDFAICIYMFRYWDSHVVRWLHVYQRWCVRVVLLQPHTHWNVVCCACQKMTTAVHLIHWSWWSIMQSTEQKAVNRPFYSCVLIYRAFEWTWGWSWPCFERNLTAFLM